MEEVFNHLYKKYHQDVFNFLYYMVHNREQAEDLVQEVYIRVLKAYQQFKGDSSEKTWLFAIARNVAIDSFRKHKGWKQRIIDQFDSWEQQVKDESISLEESVFQKLDTQNMFKCLEQCTLDQKSVIILRFLQELSIYETAKVLGWKESKVKTTQHRAIKQLKILMEEISNKEKAG
ncbi:sigma-70 family RNA polymerase sigma factor [Bacillus salipaludis]|uniref:RNA polymerase sigma factor n=1 Tax=Bacillus salipaludis TaxID=2547811 RepID=A0A4R5VVI0_9BACI|nr:RNA polymerase sigma factor SigX [Bacillus salipaludis]MDQ6597427.1 RNA polymerase sigma factor SigX [Bacillus salipaludis]TDK63145.1 sigma-70 family RNA polymerase sigma factor [Bacillus salipaludis]